MLTRKAQQLGAVGGHHLLVAGAHAAPALQALLYIRIGKLGAADGFNHHFDLGVVQNGVDVICEKRCIRRSRKITHIQNILYFHGFACTAADAGSVAAANFQHAAAHCAKAHDRNFCHIVTPLLSV